MLHARLRLEHAGIDEALERLIEAFATGDHEVARAAFRDFDVRLAAHLALEDEVLLPVFATVLASTSIFPLEADDRSVSFLPWAHVMGQTVELHILIGVGASTAFNRDLAKLIDDNREIRPTMLVAVPRIFNKIHDSVRAKIATKPRPIRALFENGIAGIIRQRRGEKLGFEDRLTVWLADLLVFRKIRNMFGGRLKYTISGGGTLSREVGEFIDALGLDVYEGYGLTETAPIVTGNRPGERKLGSVGRTIPGVRIRIDEIVGNAPGVGEIIAYGPNVMKGYHARGDRLSSSSARASSPSSARCSKRCTSSPR